MRLTRKHQSLLAAGSILAIAGSVGSILWFNSQPNGGWAFHERVGRMLAEQTAELLADQGRVTVITLDPTRFPVFNAQLAGIRQALRTHHRLRLTRTIVLPTTGDDAYGLGRGLGTDDFLRAMREEPKPDAIVSLVGVPSLRSEQIRKLGPGRPVFVAEAKFGEHLRKLLDRQLVQAAVVPRFLPATAGARHIKSDPRKEFDLYFQVVKAPPQTAAAAGSPAPKR